MFWKQKSSGECDLLIAAILEGDVSKVRQALGDGASATCKDKSGVPALLIAASRKKTEIVKGLLSNGADPNTTYHNPKEELINSPILVFSAAIGDAGSVESLIASGADIDARDGTGVTALMSAAYMGNDEVVDILLRHGAKIEEREKQGFTALVIAANSGQLGAAKLLLVKGAQVNAKANDGSTPLMFAAQHGHNEVVKVLLSHGADPEVKGRHGLSAIGFAEQNRHHETLKILRGSLRK